MLRPLAPVTYMSLPSGLKRAPIAPGSGSEPSLRTLSDWKPAACATGAPRARAANSTATMARSERFVFMCFRNGSAVENLRLAFSSRCADTAGVEHDGEGHEPA